MKIFAIKQSAATFGQTAAGCHTATGAASILASVDVNRPSADDLAAFFAAVRPVICPGIVGHSINIPVAATAAGVRNIALLMQHRKGSDAYVQADRGDVTLVLSLYGDAPVLDQGGVTLDQGNLDYQRALLRGEA